MAATIDTYIEAYWPGLTVALAALSSDLLASLKSRADTRLGNYDTSSLNADDILAAKALVVCIEAGGLTSLNEWSEDRYWKQTVAKQNKPESVDNWIGEFNRLMENCRYTAEDGSIAARYAVKYRRPSAHLAPRLDQVPIPGIDSETSDLRPDDFEDMDMEGP